MASLFLLKGGEKLNRFEIPKEIKTKPKLLGLEIKEMAILVLLIILIMTFFKDMVHGLFVIPYFIVAVGFLFYMIAPSTHNPQKKNFHALYLFFKRDKSYYHAMERHTITNEAVIAQVREENALRFGQEKIEEGYEVGNETSNERQEQEKQHGATGSIKQMPVNEMNAAKKEPTLPAIEEVKTAEEDVEVPVNVSATLSQQTVVEADIVSKTIEEVQSTLKFTADSPLVADEVTPTTTKFMESAQSIQPTNETMAGERTYQNESLKETSYTSVEKSAEKLPQHEGSHPAIFSWFKKLRPQKKANVQPIKKGDKGGGFVLKLFTHKRVNKNLVPALRSFGMQQYDEALKYFEQMDFQKLEVTDQDMMLLSYLFTGQAARAIELSPDFAETVVNYYKTTNNIEVLRQLATKVKSRVLDFEVAVDNGDYWKVIELKEFVLMKADRHQAIVQAYVALDNLHKARQYADEVGDRTLIEYVKNIVQADKETISEPLLPKENASPLLKTNLFTRNENGDYSFI